MSLPSGRQLIVSIIVVFLVYAVLTSPAESANVTSNAWDEIKDGATNVSEFFDGLMSS